MIYTDESDDLIILGGTVWVGPSEESSQARITSMTAKTSGTPWATSTIETG